MLNGSNIKGKKWKAKRRRQVPLPFESTLNDADAEVRFRPFQQPTHIWTPKSSEWKIESNFSYSNSIFAKVLKILDWLALGTIRNGGRQTATQGRKRRSKNTSRSRSSTSEKWRRMGRLGIFLRFHRSPESSRGDLSQRKHL